MHSPRDLKRWMLPLSAFCLPVCLLAIVLWPAIDLRPGDLGVPQSTPSAESVTRISQQSLDVPSLRKVARRLAECRLDEDTTQRGVARRSGSVDHGCTGVIYISSPSMPLSQRGTADISTAARDLGLNLTLLDATELVGTSDDVGADSVGERVAGTGFNPEEVILAGELIDAGATVHYPAVVIYHRGRLVGHGILGYKTAPAYRRMIGQRLGLAAGARRDGETPGANAPALTGSGLAAEGSTSEDLAASPRAARLAVTGGQELRDFRVPGQPGPYFRFVPGRTTIAFASRRRVYLLDLGTGAISRAPGYIDFVPSPDGKLFVTPKRGRAGLAFYGAAAVFAGARTGSAERVEPSYTDPEMRDEYPSVGVLRVEGEGGATETVYRVLTSWFDRVVIRDYAVRFLSSTGNPSVRELSEPVPACPNLQISIPILSPDGRELVARDEATASTKIFRLEDDGTCVHLVDLGLQTGKAAWEHGGRRIAFAIPQGVVRDGSGILWHSDANDPGLAGIFVFDRRSHQLTRVRGSEAVNRLAFPEFVGRDSIMFLLGSQQDGHSRFRLVCCVR